MILKKEFIISVFRKLRNNKLLKELGHLTSNLFQQWSSKNSVNLELNVFLIVVIICYFEVRVFQKTPGKVELKDKFIFSMNLLRCPGKYMRYKNSSHLKKCDQSEMWMRNKQKWLLYILMLQSQKPTLTYN